MHVWQTVTLLFGKGLEESLLGTLAVTFQVLPPGDLPSPSIIRSLKLAHIWKWGKGSWLLIGMVALSFLVIHP